MSEIITLGECLAVLYPDNPVTLDEAGTLLVDCAGAEANVALGLAQLGHGVRLIGRVGEDAFGRRVRARLAGVGVDTQYLTEDADAPTGLYLREWLPDGVRRVYYYRAGSAGSRLSPSDIREEMFAGARLLHLTGITPALSTSCRDAIIRAVAIAKAHNLLISFDPNYRARLWNPATAQATLLPLMAQADILLMGHEDSEALFGSAVAAEVIPQALALGATMVVFKQGGAGATLALGSDTLHIPADAVPEVIDPVGAGDAFDAGFLSGYLRQLPLQEALALGNHWGALAVQHLGDQLILKHG